MKKNHLAFTLTEVLLVSAMFAVISLAVFNAFANGFKLWARGEQVMVEGDMAIFLDRIGEDLRGVVTISGIPFKGNSTELAFPAIISAPTDNNGSRSREETGTQIGAVRYTFDPSEKKIYRSQAVYGEALKGYWTKPVEVAAQIEDISVHYYFTADKGLEVKDETDQAQGPSLPMGVMIDVQFNVAGKAHHMRRFLLVPVGGGI